MVLSRLHVLCEIFCLLLFCVVTLEEVLIEESTSIESLHAPRDGAVELPCDVTPALADDSMALVIWYKQGHDAPIYSFDSRDGVTSHWSDPSSLGPRATFRGHTTPAVLVITRLRAEDSGQYRCRVDFTKSPTKNTRLNLTVLIPPERLLILEQEGSEVRGGVLGPYDEQTNLTLTCVAVGGRPPARVSWWKSHALLANSETRAVVSFTLTRSDYGTNITCQAVTDPSLSPVSETLTIDMNLPLLWVRVLGGARPLVAGQSTELVCEAAGARPKPHISWWREGQRLTTARETISADGNVSSSVLTFVPSIADAGRVLSCRAQQPAVPHSTREDGWKLEIQHMPEVKLKLGSNLNAAMIVEGSDVYLDCTVKANPRHTHVYFTHNGAVVKPGPGVLLANQSLVLQHVSRRAAGAYVCAARSALGEGASDTLMLDVTYSPSCKSQQPRVLRAARGETVLLHCDLDANPQEPMSYEWWFNSSSHEKHELAVSTHNTHNTASSYSYTVSSVSSYGWVQCAGTNSRGRQAEPCVFTILPAEKPSAVTGCSLDNVTHSSVSMTCVRGHDGGLTQAFVLHVYDIETGLLLQNMSSSEPHWAVRGLSDRSGVRLTVRAVNKQGESEPVTLTAMLLQNPHKQTALAPVKVELSPVLALVLCAGAVVLTVTALAAVVMCFRYYKSHDHKDKIKRKQDVTSNKPLTEYEDCENDKNPDIIPIESKLSDTCSNMSSTTDHSCVRPLLSRSSVDKYDDPGNCGGYWDRACSQYVPEQAKDYRQFVPNLTIDHRQYQTNLQMHGPSIPKIGQNGQNIVPNMGHLPNIGREECQLSCNKRYEDWLKYKNSLSLNPELRFLPPPFPQPPQFVQPRPLRLVDMPDPNCRTECRTASPLSADTAVYYTNSYQRDNPLPPNIPSELTEELTNRINGQERLLNSDNLSEFCDLSK